MLCTMKWMKPQNLPHVSWSKKKHTYVFYIEKDETTNVASHVSWLKINTSVFYIENGWKHKVYLTPVMSEDIYGRKTMFWCLKSCGGKSGKKNCNPIKSNKSNHSFFAPHRERYRKRIRHYTYVKTEKCHTHPLLLFLVSKSPTL